MNPSSFSRSLVFCLVLASVVTLTGCGGPEPELGTLSGQVTDSFGRPLTGVTVTISGSKQSRLNATTDSRGQFRFIAISAVSYSLTFVLDGFEPLAETAQVHPERETLVMARMVPAAPRLGSISGQVVDPFGSPLARVTVAASGAGQSSTLTDLQGHFQLAGLPVGTYSVSFELDGFENSSQTAQVKLNQDTSVQARLIPESLPSAGSHGVRTVSVAGTRWDFEIDVVVITATGAPLEGLPSGAFTIGDFSGLRFDRLSASAQAGNQVGAYSAVMLMDQSGSILSTDPTDSRIQAGKTFFSALSAPDNAVLVAFASAGSLPYSPVTQWGTFSSVGSGFYKPLDELAQLEGGGTPLYLSVASMVNKVSSEGSNPNRAVIVFTDGEDTDGTWTLEQVIALARSKNVKLFTVGLSDSINVQVLSQMAAETQGAMLWADDARQLISVYGSLGNLLRGTAKFYRTRWAVTLSTGAWVAGTWISSWVRIQTATGTLWAPFYLKVPQSGLLPGPEIGSSTADTCPTGPAIGNRPVLCQARWGSCYRCAVCPSRPRRPAPAAGRSPWTRGSLRTFEVGAANVSPGIGTSKL